MIKGDKNQINDQVNQLLTEIENKNHLVKKEKIWISSIFTKSNILNTVDSIKEKIQNIETKSNSPNIQGIFGFIWNLILSIIRLILNVLIGIISLVGSGVISVLSLFINVIIGVTTFVLKLIYKVLVNFIDIAGSGILALLNTIVDVILNILNFIRDPIVNIL